MGPQGERRYGDRRSTSRRVAEHLRRNVVGYLALFVALSATAWAAPKITSKQIAKNAVKSKHIKDGQVTSADVADDSLTGADINESTLSGLGGGTFELGDGSVTTAKLASEAVTAAKLADGASLAELADDDGAGSGLDADLLDGISSDGFAAADHTHSGGPGGSIVDGTITNDDISNSAAIAGSKLDAHMGIFTGRVNGVSSGLPFLYGGASGYTNATNDFNPVQTLSPAVPITASDFAAQLTAPPGGAAATFITLEANGLSVIGCGVFAAQTSCDSGSGTATIPASSTLRLALTVVGPAPTTDVMFGWSAR